MDLYLPTRSKLGIGVTLRGGVVFRDVWDPCGVGRRGFTGVRHFIDFILFIKSVMDRVLPTGLMKRGFVICVVYFV